MLKTNPDLKVIAIPKPKHLLINPVKPKLPELLIIDDVVSNDNLTYKSYSPKVRQQIVSNKLLNSHLYELYTVRKLHIEGKKLKNMLLNGTIKVAGKTYVISWLDIIPMDAFKEPELVLSLRTPKYKDSKTRQYPLSYGVVSKFE